VGATNKTQAIKSGENVLRSTFNEEDFSLTTNGFLVGKLNRKIDFAYSTTNVANDTITIAFSEAGTALYTLKLIYTTSSRVDLLSAERIS